MNRSTTMLRCFLLAALWPGFVLAQQPGSAANVFLITPTNSITTTNSVTVEDYTQLVVAFEKPSFPEAGKKSKNIWLSILKALGARSDSREISAGVRVKIDDLMLPEYSLVTYTYDSKLQKIEASVSDGRQFPRKRLGAGESIGVDVFIRDRSQTQYDLKKVINFAAALIPGSTVISETSKPYVASLATMSDVMLGSLGSGQTNSLYSVYLSPYESNKKGVTLEIRTRDGMLFGLIKLSLLATPTAMREGKDVVDYRREDTLRDSEDPSLLGFDTNGIKRSYLADLKALPEYTAMARSRTDSSISNYCSASEEYLFNRSGLAIIDRTHILYRSMQDAGFGPSDVDSYATCFRGNQLDTLRMSSKGRIDLQKKRGESRIIPTHTLDALGCWMTSSVGKYCSDNAASADAYLLSMLADDLAVFVDSSYAAPSLLSSKRILSKAELINLIKGTAKTFSCYDSGMLIRNNSDTGTFKLSGEMDEYKLMRLEIAKASDDEAQCRRQQ